MNPTPHSIARRLPFQTPWQRSSRSARVLMATTVAVGALALSGLGNVAQARDNVYWSIGVNSPGVSVGASNAPPVYVQPAPVYVQPAPVYVQPRPVYVQPRPVYVQPTPVYVQPPAVVYHRPYPGLQAPRPVVVQQPVVVQGWGHPGRGHGHWRDDDRRHGGRDWDDRRHAHRDWDDDDRRGGRHGRH